MSSPEPSYSCRGLTLVEVLLALLLTGVVLVATVRLARQNIIVERSVWHRDQIRLQEEAFFSVLQRDLDGVFNNPATAPPVQVSKKGELTVNTLARFANPQTMRSPLLPAIVTYRLESTGDTLILVREQRDLTDPEANTKRLVFLRNVANIVFELGGISKERRPNDLQTAGSLPFLKVSLKTASDTREPTTRLFLLDNMQDDNQGEERGGRSQSR